MFQKEFPANKTSKAHNNSVYVCYSMLMGLKANISSPISEESNDGCCFLLPSLIYLNMTHRRDLNLLPPAEFEK